MIYSLHSNKWDYLYPHLQLGAIIWPKMLAQPYYFHQMYASLRFLVPTWEILFILFTFLRCTKTLHDKIRVQVNTWKFLFFFARSLSVARPKQHAIKLQCVYLNGVLFFNTFIRLSIMSNFRTYTINRQKGIRTVRNDYRMPTIVCRVQTGQCWLHCQYNRCSKFSVYCARCEIIYCYISIMQICIFPTFKLSRGWVNWWILKTFRLASNASGAVVTGYFW